MNKRYFLVVLCLFVVFSCTGLVSAADNQPAKTGLFQSIINLLTNKGKATVSDPLPAFKTSPCGSYGDINNDGKITIDDVNLGYEQIDNNTSFLSNIDVDGSGFAGFNDVVMINDYLTGKISTFTVCSSTTKPVVTCTDSDEGKNYFVAGATKWGPLEGQYQQATDACDAAGKTLSEYYCYYSENLNGYYSGVEYSTCPNGCKDGACIEKQVTTKDYSRFSVTELVEDNLPESITFWTSALCPTAPRFAYVVPEGYSAVSCESGSLGSHGGCSFCAMSKIKLGMSTVNNCSYIYSNWSACQDGTRTREVIAAFPDRCVEGNPVLKESCDATPSCVKEGLSIPVTSLGLNQSCCSGLTLCPVSAGKVGIRGTCQKSCSVKANPTLNVITPLQSNKEFLQVGSDYKISWNATNLPSYAKIHIALFRSNDSYFIPDASFESIEIVNGLPATQREYMWKVGPGDGWAIGQKKNQSIFAKLFGIKEVNAASPYNYIISVSATWGDSITSVDSDYVTGSSGNFTMGTFPECIKENQIIIGATQKCCSGLILCPFASGGTCKSSCDSITPSNDATLSFGVDVSTPLPSNVMVGSENSSFLNIRLSSESATVDGARDMKIKSIVIDRIGGSNYDLKSIKLFDGTTLLGTSTVSSQGSGEIIATFYPNIVVTKLTRKVLTLKADISSNATIGDAIALKVRHVDASYGSLGYAAIIKKDGKTIGNTMTIVPNLLGGSACGSAHGTTVSSVPTTNLCKMGTAGIVSSGVGLWSWACHDGNNIVALCFANKSVSNEWKIYTDSKYGFSISYPNEWGVSTNELRGAPDLLFCAPEDKDPATGECKMLSTSRISYKESFIKLFSYSNVQELGSNSAYHYLGSKNGKYYYLNSTVSTYDSIAKQMISTFKFTDTPNCSQEYNPVCGVNGKTYSNECLAREDGTTKSYVGACKKTTTDIPNPDKPLNQMSREELISYLMKLIQALLGEETTTPISTACNDSDGGQNYYTLGKTTGLSVYQGKNQVTKTDYCIQKKSGNIFNLNQTIDDPYSAGKVTKCDKDCAIMEYFCGEGGVVVANAVACPNGCNDGACTKSSVVPSITVLTPNGGENLQWGEAYDITWKSSGVDKVDISIEFEGSGGLGLATGVAASLGKYSWKTDTRSQSNLHKIIIADSSNGKVIDKSDNYFGINVSGIDDSSWKTIKDLTQGVSFKYPSKIGDYVSLPSAKWPPKVMINRGSHECTVKTIVGGNEYCFSVEKEGSAGTEYNSFLYETPKNGKVISLSFTLGYINCSNYDEPEKTKCEKERNSLDIDKIADHIISTVSVELSTDLPVSSIVSHWALDDMFGTIAKDSVGVSTGTLIGAPVSRAESHRMPGSSFSFDGLNDYVSIPSGNDNNFSSQMSASLWVKGGSQNNKIIMGKSIGGGKSWVVGINAGKPYVSISQDGQQYVNVISPNVVLDNEWHQITFTWGNSTLKLYVDGIIISVSAANFSTIYNSNMPITIGQANFYGYYQGLIEDVYLYSQALSEEQVRAVYQSY